MLSKFIVLAVINFSFSFSIASNWKNNRFSSPALSCKVAFVEANQAPKNIVLNLESKAKQFPDFLQESFYRTSNIKDFEGLLDETSEFYSSYITELQDLLKHTNRNSSHYELIKLDLARIQEQYENLSIAIQAKLDTIDTLAKNISIEDLQSRPKYEDFLKYISLFRRLFFGIHGELLAGIQIDKPISSEILIKDILNEDEIILLKKEKIYSRVSNYEIDILSENFSNWYEIKYLTAGFQITEKYRDNLIKKLTNIDAAIKQLNSKGSSYKLILRTYGDGFYQQDFTNQIELLEFVQFEDYTNLKNNKITIP